MDTTTNPHAASRPPTPFGASGRPRQIEMSLPTDGIVPAKTEGTAALTLFAHNIVSLNSIVKPVDAGPEVVWDFKAGPRTDVETRHIRTSQGSGPVRGPQVWSLEKGEAVLVGTGVRLHMPQNESRLCGTIHATSKLFSEHGLVLCDGHGVIDTNKRDEIRLILMNPGLTRITASIWFGMPIAQIVFHHAELITLVRKHQSGAPT